MHCEKMAVTDMSFHQRSDIEFLVKEGKSAGVISSDFVVCLKIPAWISAVPECG
jgi:hypothetical protein